MTTEPSPLPVDLAASIVETQPFSMLMGARLGEFADGTASTELPLRPELLQQFGSAHGGVILYLADNTATFAAATRLGPSVVTSAIATSFLRPARGVLLRARARVAASTRKTAVVHCEVMSVDRSGAETLCAVAQVTVTMLPAGQLPGETARAGAVPAETTGAESVPRVAGPPR